MQHFPVLLPVLAACVALEVLGQSSTQCAGGLSSCSSQPDVSDSSSVLQIRSQDDLPEKKAARHVREPEELVEVLVGTDTPDGGAPSNGNTLPQIKRPWGFNDWAPQTKKSGGSWWFVRDHVTFEGIRCTHQPSPWIGDYGYFTMLPLTGPDLSNYSPTHLYSQPKSVFKPYYFSTTLRTLDSDIGMELTPTNHAASIRLTFDPASTHRRLAISLQEGEFIADEGGILYGYTKAAAGGVSQNWKMYIVVRVQGATDSTRASASQTNGLLTFDASVESVTVAVATSFVSIEQATLSLDREVGGQPFDAVMAEARQEWSDLLSVYDIQAMDETALKIFYTNLWKASLFPRFLTEIDENGKEIHFSPYTDTVEDGKLVADSGFWDSYRTVYTFQSMTFPTILGATIEGWVNSYKEAKWLPQWPSPGQRGSMVGTMGDASIADAIVKSKWGLVSGFDVNIAYEAIRKDAYVPRPWWSLFGRAGLAQYIDKGYIPEADFPSQPERKSGQSQPESVSRSLNNYVADAAISRAAEALDRCDDAKTLFNRSRRYPVLFNKETQFFQPKDRNGSFYQPFDPLAWRWGFTEAGPWQYRFYVPHDVPGLQKLYKGQLCARIQEMLAAHDKTSSFHVGGYGYTIHEMREAQALFDNGFGFYAHGNQPVHHVLWLAKKAGCDATADLYLRRTLAEVYTLRGYAGDEDNGEMAAWYVLSSLGLYQLESAADELVVGSPAVVSATLQLENGQQLKVTTENQGPQQVYVHSATWKPLGGEPRDVEKNTLTFQEVMAGGSLHFVLGSEPSHRIHASASD